MRKTLCQRPKTFMKGILNLFALIFTNKPLKTLCEAAVLGLPVG